MLRASLKTLNVNVGELLAKSGITETVRAEELSVADFVRLTQVHDQMAAS
jgi:16S rRNA (adenine1518-N6/adenine1519-N6)-dimethyltransferase